MRSGQCDEFAVILEGELAVVSGGQQLALVGPGQHVGELSLIDGAPRSATVLANAETKALQGEIRALKERIQVLERIATDNNRAVTLDQEIEKLRDSSKI